MDPADLVTEDGIEVKYLKTLTIIRERLSKFDNKSCENLMKTNTKLFTINVPTFNGSYQDFRPFIQLFDSLIHNNNKLDDVQKFLYLQNFLREEPHDLFKNLTLCGEG